MMIRWHRFNTYFALALILGVSCGCNSVERNKRRAVSTLRFHVEMTPDPTTGRSQNIVVNRSVPVVLTVDKVPFLTEANVKEARVVDDRGGFALRVSFDKEGTWLLEQYTTANRNRRLAIYSQFPSLPDYVMGAGRWLAAPKINARISDGSITFTPDASHEEADMIVLGLSHVGDQLPHDTQIK